MMKTENIIEACNLVNKATTRLSQLLGVEVELTIIKPDMAGITKIVPYLLKKNGVLIVKIIQHVSDEYKLSQALTFKTHKREFADARKIASHIIFKKCEGISYAEIGEILNIDRTSALYNITKTGELIATDKDFNAKYERILQNIEQAIQDDIEVN